MKIYGVGMAKSGTHSIAGLFETCFKARHEADQANLIDLILRKNSGEATRGQVLNELSDRDDRLGLDVDSSQLNVFFLHELMTLFPDARFVFTIRDCFSWLRSYLDHQLRFPIAPDWLRLRHLRFGADRFAYSRHEHPLEQRGLYSIQSYFRYWNRHNEAVLNAVPAAKLLVIRTRDISDQLGELGRFAGVSADMLDLAKAHLFKSSNWSSVLSLIDSRFVEDQMLMYCLPLMERFFPKATPEEPYISTTHMHATEEDTHGPVHRER